MIKKVGQHFPSLASAALIFWGALATEDARASSFYTEVGGGLSKGASVGAFSGTQSSGLTDFGYNLRGGVYFRPASSSAIVELQFGFLYQWTALSQSGTSFSLQVPYPIVRLQLSRLFFGAGASPWVMRTVSAGGSSSPLSTQRANNALAYLIEGGLLWPITPKFSLQASAALSYVSLGGTLSPAPAIDGLVAMRFYWGFIQESEGTRESNEFKGWRYPFGNQVR